MTSYGSGGSDEALLPEVRVATSPRRTNRENLPLLRGIRAQQRSTDYEDIDDNESINNFPGKIWLFWYFRYLQYEPSMMSQGKTPWKDPWGSFQLLWGQFTWKDHSNFNLQLLRGLSRWNAPLEEHLSIHYIFMAYLTDKLTCWYFGHHFFHNKTPY